MAELVVQPRPGTGSSLSKDLESYIVHHLKTKMKMPKVNDELSWRQLLYGPQSRAKSSIFVRPDNIPTTEEGCESPKLGVTGHVPSLGVVVAFDQVCFLYWQLLAP